MNFSIYNTNFQYYLQSTVTNVQYSLQSTVATINVAHNIQ